MRRLLAFFLLLVLPLQMLHATAAGYCQHESGAASSHFGHHVDAGCTGAEADHPEHAKQAGKLKLPAHHDCGSCHLSMPQLPASAAPAVPSFAAEASHAWDVTRHYRSTDPTGIDRPNWPRAL
ncbi:MAG: cobalt-zinc-cadmium resistance protein [Aquabacterium sp.]|nr:MAG: cobalt-zinc-cadmium resistance protein [Aquabacterium sp.]